MYFFTTLGKETILHNEGCHYIASIKKSHLSNTGNHHTIYQHNARFCKHCNPLAAKLSAEESQIMDFCLENGLSYLLAENAILVETPHSSWKIIANNNKCGTRLYHQNDGRRVVYEASDVEGYHDQKVCCSELIQYFQYIFDHDFYRMKNPLSRNTPRKKDPPKKGTKRYRKEMKKAEKKAKRRAVSHVLQLIDGLDKHHSFAAAG